MITPAGNFRIFLVTQPVDFRKGMDGLAGHIAEHFDRDPFDGAIYVFRSRRADRLKMIVWDGTGRNRPIGTALRFSSECRVAPLTSVATSGG